MDWDGLDKLYAAYYQELFLYIYSLCQNKALAEDILQDTFLKAYFSLPNQHKNTRAWLYLVARNQFFDFQRHQKYQKDSENSIESPNNEPEETLLKNEKQRELYKAMSQLEPRKREILSMQYFVGMSHKEIGSILNIRPDYVRVLGCRAKKELKAIIEEAEHEVP